MGNSQSNYVSKSVPVVNKPIALSKPSADKDGGNLLWKVADALAEHDVGERMAQAHVIDRDCFGAPKPFSFHSPDQSGAQVLLSYKEVRSTPPLQIARTECFKPGSSDYVDNVLYSKLYDPPTPCCVLDKRTMAALALCVAAPIFCPCIALCWLVGDCGLSKVPEVPHLEKARSLMATLKALDAYIRDAPNSKGFCCFQRTIGLDKPTLRLYYGFYLLNEIDFCMSEMISGMSDISAVYAVLESLLEREAAAELRKDYDAAKKKRDAEASAIKVREDEYSFAKNHEYNDFLVAKRICCDYISNDLLDILFNNVEKTPIAGSVNFIPSTAFEKGATAADILAKIQSNYNALHDPSQNYFLPSAIVPIVDIITKVLDVLCITIRVKEPSHVVKKNRSEEERLKGTQDLLGVRMCIGNQRVFLAFADATLAAHKIKLLPNVANVVVSHKLKLGTAYLDFKIIVQLKGPNSPFFEIQIVPSANFVLDTAVKGHDTHKEKTGGAPAN